MIVKTSHFSKSEEASNADKEHMKYCFVRRTKKKQAINKEITLKETKISTSLHLQRSIYRNEIGGTYLEMQRGEIPKRGGD